jgi:16S rRNA U516 pseudouridylate synthase RsuA-like enzyme
MINSFERRKASVVPISPVLGGYYDAKEYRVLVAHHPDQEQLETWRRGVVLDNGYHTAPVKVRLEKFKGKGAWLRVSTGEGRQRQIREIDSRPGLPVVKSNRTRISSLQLGCLQPRQRRKLDPKETKALKGTYLLLVKPHVIVIILADT